MKKRRFLPLFLALILVISLTPFATAANDFAVDAKAALLVDVETGEVLYAKNIHERNYPASITKVMTALLTLEAVEDGKLSLDQPVTAGEEATQLPSGASTADIKVGETLTVEQLLCCLLIPSANEAGNILAEAVSGSLGSFVELMNRRAQELGCADTHFVNPHGLHDDDHYTTAWDIYLIVSEAMKHETFMTICGSKAYEVPATELSKKRDLHSTNYLISTWRTGWPGYYYNGADGVKTGYTPEAGYCLAASAVRGGRRLISVVLGAERIRQEDGTLLTKSFSETARLLDHGFDDFASLELISPDEFICEVPVELSGEANYVIVHPAEGMKRMVPSGLAPEDFTRTVKLYGESVDAPIAEGDELGTVTISYGDAEYGTIPLLALNDVSASWVLTKEREVKEFVARPQVRLAAAAAGALIIGVAVLRAASLSRARRYNKRRGGYSYSGYRGKKKR